MSVTSMNNIIKRRSGLFHGIGSMFFLVSLRCWFIFVFLLLLFCPHIAYPLDPGKKITQYARDNWGSEDGLPQISVSAIVQDRQGYLWLGTEEGMARFDGVRFQVFDKTNVPQMSNNYVFSLCEDNRGKLWIGTVGGGLLRRNPETGSFNLFSTENGLQSDIVWAIRKDFRGGIWVCTSKGVNCIQADTGKIIAYKPPPGIEGSDILNLYERGDGTTWIGTLRNGLFRMENETVTTVYTTKNGLTHNSVSDIYEDSKERLWIMTTGGLNCIENGTVTTYTTKEGLGHNMAWSFLEDSRGSLWLGTNGGGLNRLINGKISTLSKKNGLVDDYIRAICEDREGNVWLGSYNGGLTRLKDGKVTVYTIQEGLADNIVHSIYQDSRGNLWIGTFNGLNCLEIDGPVTTYTTKSEIIKIR